MAIEMTIKQLLTVLTILCLSFGAGGKASAQDQTVFLSVLEDVPVMPGLMEDRERAVLFDVPAGRVAETILIGSVAPDIVRRYYQTALPQLGWVIEQPDLYRRNREILTVHPVVYGSETAYLVKLYPVNRK
jgi:hypothetical protein